MDARRANQSNNKQNEFSELKKECISDRNKIIDDKILAKLQNFGYPNFDIDARTKNTRVTSRNSNPLFLLLRIVMKITVIKQQWIVLCLVFTLVSAYKEQKFAIEPQDQSAVIGSRVTLPCRVESKAGQLQWTKDDFGLGTHRQLSGYERYKMIGSDEEGDYSLDIREVTLDDDALYQCQVSTGSKGEPAIRSRYARLIILVPPEPPKIKPGPILQAVEDREVTVECYSIGGKPAAEITWVDNEGGVLSQGVTYTVEQMPDGRRFTAKSVLRLRPRRQHHNQTFTCQAQNTADRTYKAATVKIQVQYAPRVKVFVKSGAATGRIREGEVLILGCQASANPNNLTYKWFVNNEEIVNVNYNELVLSNVSRRHNEATVKCEVHNAVGNSADTKTLEVAYPPTFKTKPQNVEGDPGTTVILSCLVQGHPPPKVVWLRYENERIIRVGKTSNLSVTVTKQSAGQYWCRASADGFKDIESLATIYVKGPPKIISNQTQNGLEGDSVRVECISFSVPKPEYVSWTFGGKEINTYHDQEYAFLEESLPEKLTKSTLIIRESQSRHFGIYNCTVTNAYGSDSVEINLVPDKSLPLIVVVASGASTAIFFLIVVFIFMLCYRKSNKSDVKKPDITDIGKTCVDQFKDSDRSSNISDLKLELRQVEGSCDMDLSNPGSESELRSTLHLTTNLGLPLAGPVPLPESGYDNELMKQYQRYSGDFNQAINNLHLKNQGQNGYVPYVDYSRDYAPPQSTDALTGSLSRSTDISSYPSHYGSLHRQSSCGRLGGMIGPDVIPMANPGVMFTGGVDVRYAATYGNPYLRGSGPLPYSSQVNGAHQSPPAKPAPPPYYSVRNSNIPPLVTSITSSSSSSASRLVTSPLGSTLTNSGAQPQVPTPPHNPGAHYILPPSNQGNSLATQITAKGNGSILKAGTHV